MCCWKRVSSGSPPNVISGLARLPFCHGFTGSSEEQAARPSSAAARPTPSNVREIIDVSSFLQPPKQVSRRDYFFTRAALIFPSSSALSLSLKPACTRTTLPSGATRYELGMPLTPNALGVSPLL